MAQGVVAARRKPAIGLLASVAVGLAAVYASFLILLFLFQRDLLYQPFGRLGDPASAGVPEMTAVTVTAGDGVRVTGWYAKPPDPEKPTLVLYHGNAGSLAMRAFKARVFLDAGLGVWLAGYRGFDGNPGAPSEEGLYRDARAVIDWLVRHGTPSGRVVVYGESLGTGVAVQMALEWPLAAVVLESPFTSIPDVAAERYPLAPVGFMALDRFDSLTKIGRLDEPVLIMHGEDDRVVPARFGRQLFQAAPHPKLAAWLPGADHYDLFDRGGGRIALEFVRRLLR